MFAAGVISVRGGCNKCSRGNTWNKQPATDQSDYSISLKYGINTHNSYRIFSNSIEFSMYTLIVESERS